MAGLGPDPEGQLGRVAERGQRSVEEPDDLADDDLPGRPAKPVAPLATPPARDDPGVLQGQEDRLEKLLRNPFPLGDLAGRDDSSLPPLGEVEKRLEGVETALGDFQMYPYGFYRIFICGLRVNGRIRAWPPLAPRGWTRPACPPTMPNLLQDQARGGWRDPGAGGRA